MPPQTGALRAKRLALALTAALAWSIAAAATPGEPPGGPDAGPAPEAFDTDGIAGVLALPAGDVPEPFVDADDVADVAVAALTGDGHAGRTYEVTGPRALTFAGLVGEVARATGRPVRYERVPVAAWTAGAREAGIPDDALALMTYLFTTVLDGRNSAVADGVQQALGRPPADVAGHLRAAVPART